MSTAHGTVLVVDDDESLRRAVTRLGQSVGYVVKTFASARDFLDAGLRDRPACLVLDVRMAGMSGLELHAELRTRNMHMPVVFITGHGDIPMSVRAMKAGAFDFLTKPFRNQDLLTAIQAALAEDQQHLALGDEREAIERRLERLTPREREVFDLLIRGRMNKEIAAQIGTSVLTVKVHRARVMEKMEVESLACLVQAAAKIGVLTV